MNLFEEIRERNVEIPKEYNITESEIFDIYHHATSLCAAISACFKYGFERGRASKAAETVAPAKVEVMRTALDSCNTRELQLVYFFMKGLDLIK